MRGPDKPTTSRARNLRQSDNDAEWQFWPEVRNRRPNGFKFVRQFPIGPYFADFACRDVKLALELDGSRHAESEYDATRNNFMISEEWSVARFLSHDVLQARSSVLETVVAIRDGRLTEPVDSRDFRFFPAFRL